MRAPREKSIDQLQCIWFQSFVSKISVATPLQHLIEKLVDLTINKTQFVSCFLSENSINRPNKTIQMLHWFSRSVYSRFSFISQHRNGYAIRVYILSKCTVRHFSESFVKCVSNRHVVVTSIVSNGGDYGTRSL